MNRRKDKYHMRWNRLRAVCVSILLCAGSGVSASDVATFVNLGFSSDSGVFMFAQYGIDGGGREPYAEIYTVDVPANDFVANGNLSRTFDMVPSLGQDGSGALFELLPEIAPTADRYRINHLRQGRPIYLFVNGDEERERIEFRDFESGSRYVVTLTQDRRERGETVSAAFHLTITARYADGSSVERVVGLPDYYRTGVDRYRIKQIIASPDERSLVTVVERITVRPDGERVRYMVETVRLR